MLDIKFVRENVDLVKKSELKRGHNTSIVDEVLRLDNEWKQELKIMQELNHLRNKTSEEVNQAKKDKNESLANEKIAQMREVIDKVKEHEKLTQDVLEQRNNELKKIGNILDDKVPQGKNESENVEVKKVGKIPKFDFEPKDHIELGESLDLIELDKAAKVSCARFYYLKNEAVLLDLALQRYALDKLLAKGYELVFTPFMLNKNSLKNAVNMEEFESTIYKIENEDLYLIGTSEHPLIALKEGEIMPKLPLKLCGISSCFRKEAGTHGRDDKGLFRVHQFNKIEQMIFCNPEDSPKFFDYMQEISEELFTELGIPFRVINICTGDLGNKQSLQYDIEGWFPGQNDRQGQYRELTSCSNCLNYQAVDANIKNINKEYVHILNNTAIATARAMAAIIENYQTKEGTVKIPAVLQPYMNNIAEIKPKTL
jgi:seryl-tRNA synthetase